MRIVVTAGGWRLETATQWQPQDRLTGDLTPPVRLSDAILVAAGRADETDTALALAAARLRAAGRADETDTALALAAARLRAVGRANETDTALALAAGALVVGRANETDTALAPNLRPHFLISDETDTALALGIHRYIFTRPIASSNITVTQVATSRIRIAK